MKFISLFAGIGGFDLGFERAGMECIAQVEIDPFCRKVLAKHWPDVERFEDVRKFGKHNAPPANLICGGFPCQPHSLAGKRKGADDDRNIWPEYRRIVGEFKPRWVVAENVPGIRTTILDQVLSDLESLDYSARVLIVPACAFDAPHRRERVFIIANQNGQQIDMAAITWKEIHNTGGNGASWNVTNPDGNRCGQVEQPNGRRTQGQRASGQIDECPRSWWSTEPGICGVADGVPNRVDRLRSLGNAVVPQVAEWIGRYIIQVDNLIAKN